MNVPFYTTINVFLCISSLLPIIPNSSGLFKGKSQFSGENHKVLRRTMTIIMSDSRGKRHNLPLVGVDNVDLHRIATCTKAPGRLVCKSGRYNYVINNGNFEFPAETLEKFVSALYQKAKDKESDFAVSLLAPEKESAPSVSQLHSTLPTYYAKMTTDSADQLQPVTIECELTDAKKLKETNPDYQPKPNEKVFKCNTKRLGMNRKRDALHALVKWNQTVNTFGVNECRSLRNAVDGPPWRTSRLAHQWKLYQPFSKTSEERSLQKRSLSFSTLRVRGWNLLSLENKNRKLNTRITLIATIKSKFNIDFMKKTGFASMFQKPDLEDEGIESEKDVAGVFHQESPRPRVRDYNHSCAEGAGLPPGWCPLIRSTPCVAPRCTFTTTIHPTFYTTNPEDELCPDQERRIRRISYKFHNPLLEFFMPFGIRSFTKGEPPHCSGCACSKSTTTHHVHSADDFNTESDGTGVSRKIMKDEDEEVLTPSEDEYYDSPVSTKSKCKCSQHRKHSDKHECGKGHKHQFVHKHGCVEDSDIKTEKNHMKECRKHNLLGGNGNEEERCECELYSCCGCPPQRLKNRCVKS